MIASFATAHFSSQKLLVAALVLSEALVFEEVMTYAARMRTRFGAELRQDMQAVWGVAAALALPGYAAVTTVSVLWAYAWLRHERPSGIAFHRELVNGANVVIACVVAGWVFDGLGGDLLASAWNVRSALIVVLTVAVYTAINRAVASVTVLSRRAPVRAVLGTVDDNLIELATLCLGALVAVALIAQPLLSLLVLAPMISLQRAAAVRELETAASTDAKTGLLNAVAWEQIASRALARARRDDSSLSVLIIDIDHFKRVNDNFGHLAGDTVLRFIGRLLSAELREYDTLARFGGEEFVAVLPNSTVDDSLLVAERLRARIAAARVSHAIEIAPEDDRPLAVSIGVASDHGGDVELHQLLLDADQALYRAKELGRDQVVFWGVCSADSAMPGAPHGSGVPGEAARES